MISYHGLLKISLKVRVRGTKKFKGRYNFCMVKTTKCPHTRWDGKIRQKEFDPTKLVDIISVFESAQLKCTGCNSIGSFDKDFYDKLAAALKTKAKNMSK